MTKTSNIHLDINKNIVKDESCQIFLKILGQYLLICGNIVFLLVTDYIKIY